jgi:hypothetical protein
MAEAGRTREVMATNVFRIAQDVRRLTKRLQPIRPDAVAAMQRRWADLPEHVRTPAQLVGRRSLGCEGTHGVFPACDFACKPCYHSVDANRVRVDGPHTIAAVDAQMSFLESTRGPGAYAQLIGGEVSLLDPHDHATALQSMRAHGRIPMSMTHGDFDETYLRSLVLDDHGNRRLRHVSFAAHIDSTMYGRRGAEKPGSESELHDHRARFCQLFERLRRDHGVSAYLAHNMTVTPDNIGEVGDVVATCRAQGWRMFSFQPAAYVGNERRWQTGFRTIDDDAVWSAIESGVGRSLPYRVLQFGDLRCNRVSWGAFVGSRYVPVFEEDDQADFAMRDAFLAAMPGGFLPETNAWINTVRALRVSLRRPSLVVMAASWGRRFVRRAGGIRAVMRSRPRPVTFVMHRFMDAAVVAPAWDMLQRGEIADEPDIRAAQERLQACVYTMGHPETGLLVPACAQHAVLDPEENRRLAVSLPLPTRRPVA